MSGQGFASMTKGRLRDVGSKGGKNANKSGTKHQWNKAASGAAAAKSVQVRMRKGAEKAFKRLVDMGYDPAALAKLGLSDKELVYYGGLTSKLSRRKELQARLEQSNAQNL